MSEQPKWVKREAYAGDTRTTFDEYVDVIEKASFYRELFDIEQSAFNLRINTLMSQGDFENIKRRVHARVLSIVEDGLKHAKDKAALEEELREIRTLFGARSALYGEARKLVDGIRKPPRHAV